MDLDDRGILTTCPSCGTMNRLPYRTLDRATRCGKCHATLPPPASPIDIGSAAAFDALMSSSALPVVVDFWAPWCGPCRMMAPEVEKAARHLAGDAIVVKLNTEAEPALAGRFGIQSIPTLAVFRDGREAGRLVGARPAADIEALVPQRTAAGRTGHPS
jgi:thioredoxin 2